MRASCDAERRTTLIFNGLLTHAKEGLSSHFPLTTVQAGIANGVLDAMRAGDIPKEKANDLGIIVSVWLDPSVTKVEVDHNILFETNRQATAKAIFKETQRANHRLATEKPSQRHAQFPSTRCREEALTI